MATNLLQLADELRTDADAYRWLEQRRWGDKPVCPHCGVIDRHYFLKPADGKTRKTSRGTRSERRVWKCKACRKQFTVTVGTIFHGSHVPLRTWLLVIFDACCAKHGIAAREIERKYGLSSKSAWHLMHRIREAMRREPIAGLLSGRVIADETWYGGKPSNRHGHDPRKPVEDWRERQKTTVMCLVSRETGEVRSRVVPDVRGETLGSVMAEQVDMANTHLHTDQFVSYGAIAGEFAGHSVVNHKAHEYVRGDVTTNHAESYFAQLKRSLDGTHHHVSREHLDRYLAEFDFRYSTCKLTDAERMSALLGRVGGRRLMYREPAVA